MKLQTNHSERGIAMLVVLFALILVSAIGLALMFSTNSETGVNSGFRQSNLSYFSARSGVEELRDRMRVTVASGGISDILPAVPIGAVGGVVYITNLDTSETANLQFPWNKTDNAGKTNLYFDDELCHQTADNTQIANSPGDFSKPCPVADASLPTTVGWHVDKTAQALPGNAYIPYKWARVNLKLQESSSPWCILGYGNCARLTPGGPSADQVCYNGKNEFVLADLKPIDVPGKVQGVSLPSELALAMGMFEGGSAGHGNSGHASVSSSTSASTSASGSSSTSATTGTTSGSSSGSSSSGTSSSGSSASSSSASTSTTGLTSTSTTGVTTGLIGTGTTSTTGATGLIGTGSTSSTSTNGNGKGNTTSSSSSSSASSSSSSTSTSTSSSSSGSPPPACGTAAPPMSGALIGIGPNPVNAASCIAADSQPVYMLTALAVAPNASSTNKARRMVQYEVARIALPPMPAALTISGPIVKTRFGDSNNFIVNGTDTHVGCAAGQDRPAVGTVQDVGNGTETASQVATDSRNVVINDLKRPDHYTGVSGCSPDVQNVNNLSNENYTTVDGLNALVHDVQNSATQTINARNPPASFDFGSPANPKITVINGDYILPITASQGAGILLVTGRLTIEGNTAWNGLLLVVGTGELIVNGTPQINGAVLVAKIGKDSGCASGNGMTDCYANNPTDTNLLNSPKQLGEPEFTWNGGGIGGIQYDSCKIQAAKEAANYTVIARREITY